MALVAVPPCPIPYQGSKRKLVPFIVQFLPDAFSRLYEPFAGSAAVSLGVALQRADVDIRLNDNNAALAALWSRIIDDPVAVAVAYERLWKQQLSDPRQYYKDVRAEFNESGEPELLLYLLARCVKAAVRYNSRGEFNQSPDNRRLGSKPDRMAKNIAIASALLRGRTRVTALDFRVAVMDAMPDDVIYMDPPYQGVSTNRDRRYADIMAFDEFVDSLFEFNDRELSFILSYDGRTGDKTHGKPLPEGLLLRHYELDAGRSTQSTLSGGDARTIESLYISPALVSRLAELPAQDQNEAVALF